MAVKQISILIAVLFAGLLVLPIAVSAATNDVTFDEDVIINLWEVEKNWTIESGGTLSSYTVNGGNVSLIMISTSTITIKSADGKRFLSDNGEVTSCSGGTSVITIAPGSDLTVVVSPTESTVCGGGVGTVGSSGGAVATTPTVTTTTTVATTTTSATTTTPAATPTPSKPISQMTKIELQAEVVRITALIIELQKELLKMIGGGGGQLTKNLKYNDRGDEVTLLQTWLANDSSVYPEKKITGWFGSLTKTAVIRFQEKYASEILAPLGLLDGTGIVAGKTRAKLNSLYGR